MDRRNRHLVVIAIAVLTAGLASFGVYRAITNLPVREVEVASRYVVVAARELPPGVRVSKDDVRLAAWPDSSPVAGSHNSIDDVVNRALLATVVENEPLLDNKLANRDAGAGLPPSIPPGMRAMAVRVNEVIGVAGFLDPGTRVDLVVTIRSDNETTSRTVVSNVQVLTSGTRGEQDKARTAKTSLLASAATAVVTLLVSPQDAERIALAQVEGQIMLVLRNPLDTAPTETTGIRTAALMGAATPAPPVVPVTPRVSAPRPDPKPEVISAAPKPYVVEAIRAAKRTEEEVVQ